MLGNKPPYTTMQQLNLDWVLSKLKTLLRLVPDDGAVGQILRRTRDGAVWSDEQGGGGGGAVQSVNGKTGVVVLDADDVGALPDDYTPPVTSVNGQTGVVVLGKSDVGLANVDNVKQYSATNPPPYPVTSVNGQTGTVVLDADDVGALPDDYTPPVTSVNGQTGAVVIPTGGAVDSVNGQTGTVVLDSSDIGSINPPDIINAQRTALTSGTALNVTSTGAWYCVAAINRNTSGDCAAWIGDQSLNVYYASVQVPSGDFKRALTPWLYFPAGAQFTARALFTYADTSGLFKAEPLT